MVEFYLQFLVLLEIVVGKKLDVIVKRNYGNKDRKVYFTKYSFVTHHFAYQMISA